MRDARAGVFSRLPQFVLKPLDIISALHMLY